MVCRMLGFGSTIGHVYNGSMDFRGDGPVWIRLTDEEVCNGNEATLEQCKVFHTI